MSSLSDINVLNKLVYAATSVFSSFNQVIHLLEEIFSKVGEFSVL